MLRNSCSLNTLSRRAAESAQYTPRMSTSPSTCIVKLPSSLRSLFSHVTSFSLLVTLYAS